MLLEANEGAVDPDYFQFYLTTRSGSHAASEVTGAGYEAHLEACSPGFIYVGTLKKYSPIPIRVEVHDVEPESSPEAWQHVVEDSFVGDGVLDVLSWPDEPAFRVATPVGTLRVRAQWAGLEAGLAEGMRDDGSSDEHLELRIWPAPAAPRRVLRWWHGWRLPDPRPAAPDGRVQIEGVDEVMKRITGRMRSLPVYFASMAEAPELPGGGGTTALIWGDLDDGSWWADGYAERRVLRRVTEDEVRALVARAKPMPRGIVKLPKDSRWSSMLKSVGLRED
jgi:hypothetical protein